MIRRPHTIPRVLSIAGTDPTGGAGIQADLKSIAANGGYGMAVTAALVAQNTVGVRSVHVPPAAFLREQLDAVSDDVVIDAVKIGMLATADVIDVVRDWLQQVSPPVVVLDPVMVATSGDRLLDRDAETALRALTPLAHLVTPNLPELAILADSQDADTWDDAITQATLVARRDQVRVLVKGGHLSGETAPDALVEVTDGTATVTQFPGERVRTTNTHGTGCSLSSALATRFAATGDWRRATEASKAWLVESITRGAGLHVGAGHGPISHFAGMWDRAGIETTPTADAIRTSWWSDIADIRDDIDNGRFVRQLGDGTLSEAAFRFYLQQDALYLRDYARVLAHASSLAPTADEQAFWAGGARDAIIVERQLHEHWLGTNDVDAAAGRPQTTAYLDHLLATAARGNYEVLTAAVLPCYWLYADLGTRLRARSHPQHPYSEWLATYADDAFTAAADQALTIAARTAAEASPAVRASMRAAFRTSAAHEAAFFAAPFTDAAR